jgi:anti-sigma B factor antagonist
MLNIVKERLEDALTVKLEGRLDTTTAPELEAALHEELTDLKTLLFDLTGLEYISSAGLRVLLSTQKTMNRQGSMKLVGVRETIMEIFEITGFCDILTIE